MKSYGIYIFSAYGLTILILLTVGLWMVFRLKKTKKEWKKMQKIVKNSCD